MGSVAGEVVGVRRGTLSQPPVVEPQQVGAA